MLKPGDIVKICNEVCLVYYNIDDEQLENLILNSTSDDVHKGDLVGEDMEKWATTHYGNIRDVLLKHAKEFTDE